MMQRDESDFATTRELADEVLAIDFWLRPDVPEWKHTKDELLDRRAELTAVLASRRELKLP